MRMPRCVLVCQKRSQFFHVISRVVDRRIIFGDKEKEYFLSLLRCYEGFTGVKILSYCLMGNHFHLLIHVPPKPSELSVVEIRNRMKCIYSNKKLIEFDELINANEKVGNASYVKEFYDGMSQRMYSLSHFVREVKLKFSKWYNGNNDRKGTLWEERFKSVLIEGDPRSLLSVSAYIDLNPVRAGVCSEPHNYRFCSYTEAVSGGSKARKGISQLFGGHKSCELWGNVFKEYTMNLARFALAHTENLDSNERAKYQAVLDSGGEFSFGQLLLCKFRYFSSGVILGRRKFVDSTYHEQLSKRTDRRVTISTLSKTEGLYSYRNLNQ